MISEAMAFYGLHRDFEHAGYFPTPHDEKIFDALKVAVRQGQLVVLSGIVGCGKSKLLRRIKDDLQRETEQPPAKAGGLVIWTESPDTGPRPVVKTLYGHYPRGSARNDVPDTFGSSLPSSVPRWHKNTLVPRHVDPNSVSSAWEIPRTAYWMSAL